MSIVKTPADLVSAVPFLIGYHPTNSLVVISVKDDALEMAMRVDMPTNEQPAPAGAFDLLASHLVRDNAKGALLIAYSDDRENNKAVLWQLHEAVMKTDVEIREMLEVFDGKFRSLLCSDESCCPADGNELPEFESSVITAEQVAQGKVLPFANVADMSASLASNELATDPLFDDLVKTLVGVKTSENRYEFDSSFQRLGAEALNELKATLESGEVIENGLKARVIAGVQDIQVRDYALGLFNDNQTELAKSAYMELMKSAPAGFAHPLASLASAYAYENGEGALAHRLLDKAFEIDPEYSLARLLRRVFSSGWPPAGFSQLRKELHPRVTATIFGAK